MRIRKIDVEAIFVRLMKAYGLKETKYWNLDYTPIYGGYIIEKIDPKNGSVSHPLGNTRLNRERMYEALDMTCLALELKKAEELYAM